MTDKPRLIERAFPLKQTSLDSVHEKNVRHGHISTLHIWPARRPLAACRAALIATLLPDPGTPKERRKLCEKIGGKVVQKIEKKKMPSGRVIERIKEETEGGILHWKRETENAETLEWFRQEIRKAYGGRAPRVLDPFAGGGAIPLEAMRLGCEVTAVDINPMAWFILKCTLEYPQRLAGKTHPLPDFILEDEEFMAAFRKANGLPEPGGLFDTETFWQKDAETRRRGDAGSGKVAASPRLPLSASATPPEADLAWHVRAWGKWVLDRARRELAKFYPTYAEFEPIGKDAGNVTVSPSPSVPASPPRLVPLKDDGTPDIDSLNAEFSEEYLADPRNPRWVAKPTVAYLWARTVTCKNCRATVPLLKTRWLCKKSNKRVLLTMEPNKEKTGVVFEVENDVPVKGGNAAQRREHDKRTGAGTMSRAGAKCPCCLAIMTMEDIRLEGKAGRLGSLMTAVVVDGQKGKEYLLPTQHELAIATPDNEQVEAAFKGVPYGVPDEPTPAGGGTGAGRAFSVQGYGLMKWRDLFTPRQLVSLGTFVAATRDARVEMAAQHIPADRIEAVGAYLALVIGRTANYLSTVCLWDSAAEEVKQTFLRFALPITWDYAEANPMSAVDRYFAGGLSKVVRVLGELLPAALSKPAPTVVNKSAIANRPSECDLIVTDPPYYDAIPYSDLMDFFYIWLRRSVYGAVYENAAFASSLSPKWDHGLKDGELIDDSSRHLNNAAESKQIYEDGMARAFVSCAQSLRPNGRMVIVFANKQPAAWETLVSALIRSGFVVDGSWPIATEMRGGVRNFARASLASSVWLVCKKRPETALPGWDNKVMEEMRANIVTRLREFWDAGIRGPDFVWAATGPALEAYSKHPVVKKANDAGKTMEVSEFLSHVRRMVVDFVVGQVLSGDDTETRRHGDFVAEGRRDMETRRRRDAEKDGITASPHHRVPASASSSDVPVGNLDAPTAYYLLHRHDFGLEEAPSGACILYAMACGLSDRELESTWDILARTGSDAETRGLGDTENEDGDDSLDSDMEIAEDTGGGSKVKLRTWAQRTHGSMGYEAPGGHPVPLIDRIHRLMHLWRAGDVLKVDEYLDDHGLRRQELFKRLLQSMIELSRKDGESQELQTLESLSNHVQAKGAALQKEPALPFQMD